MLKSSRNMTLVRSPAGGALLGEASLLVLGALQPLGIGQAACLGLAAGRLALLTSREVGDGGAGGTAGEVLGVAVAVETGGRGGKVLLRHLVLGLGLPACAGGLRRRRCGLHKAQSENDGGSRSEPDCRET